MAWPRFRLRLKRGYEEGFFARHEVASRHRQRGLPAFFILNLTVLQRPLAKTRLLRRER
jgi:hypothetical protein